MKWTRESIRSDLKKLLAEHIQNGAEIAETSHLVGDLGIDSLGVMEIVANVEDTFSLIIPDEALKHVETVADVAGAIESRLAAEGRLDG
jgi:acyl carrier protein